MRLNCTSEGRRFRKRRSLYKTNQPFSSKSGMQWRSKASVLMKRKNISSILEYLPVKKISALNHPRK
jgi:hypothetical protein